MNYIDDLVGTVEVVANKEFLKVPKHLHYTFAQLGNLEQELMTSMRDHERTVIFASESEKILRIRQILFEKNYDM